MAQKREYKILDYIVIFLLIINVASASTLCYNFMYVMASLLFILAMALSNKFVFRPIIVYVLLYCVLVEIAASCYLSNSLNLYRLFNYIYPILFAYCSISILKTRLLPLLERVIFFLTIFSLPLFCLQLINLPFIESLSSLFSQFLAEPLRYENSWYAFIFNYCSLREGTLITRNSGFMWEPGAFAMVLVIMIVYRLVCNGDKLKDTHVLIYLIALATTFSTAGYIALLLILISVLFKKRSIGVRFSMLLVVVAMILLMFRLDFINVKISEYITNTEDFVYAESGESNAIEFNRYLYFLYTGQKVLEFPIGYGTSDVEYNGYMVIAPNGLANIMYHWGLIGLLFLSLAFYRFVGYFKVKLPVICLILLGLAMFVVMFSNPVDKSPILYIVILITFLIPYNLYESSSRM